MSFADRFASRLSAPASRVLDGPIREIVQQVLREGGYATPAEVEQLHGEARDLSRRVEALEARANELSTQSEGMKGRVQAAETRATSLLGELHAATARLATAEGASAAHEATESRLAAVETELAQVRSQLAEALAARPSVVATQVASPAPIVVAETAPVVAERAPVAEAGVDTAPSVGCKVAGCGGNVRSKGFCSAHYQQWRRGTLKRSVNQHGTVQVDGQAFTLSESWAGGFATLVGGKVHVDGVAAN